MRPHTTLTGLAAFALTLALSGCSPAPTPADSRLWIRDVNVIDVEAGRVVPAQDIAIDAGRIAEIRPHDAATAGDGIDGRGAFAVPGLYDAHTHIDTTARIALMLPDLVGRLELDASDIDQDLVPYLAYGVTGIVVLNGNDDILAARERAHQTGAFLPRIVSSSPILDGPDAGNPVHRRIASAAAGVAAVDEAAERGFDLIKTYHIGDKDTRDAIIARAAELGMPVAGHLPPGMPFDDAIVPGFSNVAHAEEITRMWDGEDRDYLDHAIDLMSRHGTYFTPNLVAYREIAAEIEDIDKRLASLDWTLTPPLARLYATPPNNGYVNDFGAAENRDRFAAYFRRTAATMDELTLAAREHGVPLLAGTDTGNPTMLPGQSLYRELELLQDAGLDGYDALAAATINVARLLGEDRDRGSIAVGKVADIVLLRVNPAEQSLSRDDVEAVLRDGVVFDAARIAAEIAQAGAAYTAREARYREALAQQ